MTEEITAGEEAPAEVDQAQVIAALVAKVQSAQRTPEGLVEVTPEEYRQAQQHYAANETEMQTWAGHDVEHFLFAGGFIAPKAPEAPAEG